MTEGSLIARKCYGCGAHVADGRLAPWYMAEVASWDDGRNLTTAIMNVRYHWCGGRIVEIHYQPCPDWRSYLRMKREDRGAA